MIPNLKGDLERPFSLTECPRHVLCFLAICLQCTSNPTSSAEAAPPGLDATDDDGKIEEFLNYDGYEEEEGKPNVESSDGWLMFATVLAVIFGSGVFLCTAIFLARFFGLIALLRRL